MFNPEGVSEPGNYFIPSGFDFIIADFYNNAIPAGLAN
jgi:hypothetical protein